MLFVRVEIAAQNLVTTNKTALAVLCVALVVFVALAVLRHDSPTTLAEWRQQMYERYGTLSGSYRLLSIASVEKPATTVSLFVDSMTAKVNPVQKGKKAEKKPQQLVQVFHRDEVKAFAILKTVRAKEGLCALRGLTPLTVWPVVLF